MAHSVATWSDESFSTNPTVGRELVSFRTVQKKDEFQSKHQERPVYKEITHIVIRTAGDSTQVLDIPVTEAYKQRYPQEWARWQQTRQNQIPGFPIENWPALTDTQKAEFKAMNIFTLEQFVNMPDSHGQKIMGFNDLRRKAKVFLEAGKDAELLGRIRQEAETAVAAEREKREALERQVAEMKEAFAKMKEREKARA